MVRNSIIITFLLFLYGGAFAQTNRYIVFFKDKNGTPYSLAQPSQFLSQKAIARRERQNITLIEEDLPVNPLYVAQVKSTGAQTFFTSRWMNCLLVQTNAATADQIKSLPSVKSVEFVAPNSRLSGGRIRKIRSKNETSAAPATLTQLNMIGISQMHSDGYKGEGINIAVLDAGFLGVNSATPFQHIFVENRMLDTFDFISKSGNVYSYDDHGTEVLSVIGALLENSFTGGAYKANFHLYVTEDESSEYRVEEYNWLFAAERADSVGVDVINSSLGYNLFDDASMDYTKSQLNGKTAVISQAASMAIARGIVVVCSAGNEGNNSWQLVTPPADVEGVIATGSVTSTSVKSSFSSVGPTTDNRIKPDVVALGSGTSVIKPSGTLGTTSGTSLASPLIASLAAGILQTYPFLTVSEIYAIIVESCSQALHPDNKLGYGIPNYTVAKGLIETSKLNDEIVLYPNPVTGSSVKIALKNPSEEVHVLIYGTDGKKIKESTFAIMRENNPTEYDLSLLSAGMYFIKVSTGNSHKTMRLVKL
jgi:serine protease AprX